MIRLFNFFSGVIMHPMIARKKTHLNFTVPSVLNCSSGRSYTRRNWSIWRQSTIALSVPTCSFKRSLIDPVLLQEQVFLN